ncbi:Beta-1,4-galactosyltransferase CpsIVG [Methanosarcina siciliae HI350]|uniref:Beta-1,4-galactosyltransferase CpsIVG n=1 Tax=Methanosarcina siciliae HI350 TaxID=1434119 RepID=A0A0E3PFP0_9EURY|nr:PssE/Cps14G family polysaccharide biosynthesis glycosyltransferase [Methanosarcina siciliae]AKB33060.1 Beta-1,4-galactosyltransferase CpsIVG [Methanosarcina siciliae HI350]
MIFVTVGSHYQGFDRLVKKMDEIAGKIDEKVIMQIGNTNYKPVNAEYFSFLESFEEILRLNQEARVVVSHAGAGSIITALKEKTSVIVVPRLRRYDEHMNDHQLEIAKAMSENKNITVIYDVEALHDCLKSDFIFVEEFVGDKLATQLKKYILSLY